MKKIKNYTTDVPAQKTIMEVQNMLLEAGASAIMMESEAGQIKGIFFKMKMNESDVPFKLPAKPEKVYSVLFAGMVNNHRYGESRKEKSTNIAWRIVKDWLAVQLSLIHMEMADPAEIFFPFMLTGANTTLYEQAKATGFDKLLPSPNEL